MSKTTISLTQGNMENVTSSWACPDCTDEDSTADGISFLWVEQNGTPLCECGCDMELVSVEVEKDLDDMHEVKMIGT